MSHDLINFVVKLEENITANGNSTKNSYSSVWGKISTNHRGIVFTAMPVPLYIFKNCPSTIEIGLKNMVSQNSKTMFFNTANNKYSF